MVIHWLYTGHIGSHICLYGHREPYVATCGKYMAIHEHLQHCIAVNGQDVTNGQYFGPYGHMQGYVTVYGYYMANV